MERIDLLTPGRQVPIFIEDGLNDRLGELIRTELAAFTRVVVVSNPTVAEYWADSFMAGLQRAGISAIQINVPDGEQYKTLETVASLYERFLKADLDSKGIVVALGGGVIGDMTGFAAATFKRGVEFIQVPTTLLAMVDASVGGKTGVDLPAGKNLVGAYKQPAMVLIDTTFLSTLPKKELNGGAAEVLKHGIIGDASLFDQLEAGLPKGLAKLVADAVRVKVAVVSRDPFERGERAVLNLGHTFGHALELRSDFQIPHGEAVALGLIAATKMSASMGKCAPELVGRVKGSIRALSLPTQVSGYGVTDLEAAMKHDKKKIGGRLRFILPTAIGKVQIVDSFPQSALEAGLLEILEE